MVTPLFLHEAVSSTNPLYLAVLGIVLFWMGVNWLARRGLLPSYIGTQGPILTIHTRRFQAVVERLARPRRFWRAWSSYGVGITLVVMVGMFAFFLLAGLRTVLDPVAPTQINQPRNVVAIPGVNEFLPLSVAPEIIAALVIGLIVHEGGHAIMCRVADIEIESMGIALFTIIPIGAFVEPDDESRRRAPRGDQTRMFAAGLTNNFAVTILVFALLFGPVAGSIGVADGAAIGGVLPGSAAETAGIQQGDRIVAVNDRPIETNDDLEATLAGLDDRTVDVLVETGDGARETPVERSILVTAVIEGAPFLPTIAAGTEIVAVNGTAVHTEGEFREALAERKVATLETATGATATGPVGALVRFSPDGPAVDAGVTAGASAVITEIDGARITGATDLSRALDGTRPGDVVALEYYQDGERRTADVELGTNPQSPNGFLGVGIAQGTSGITTSDFGVRLYPADRYLGFLDGRLSASYFHQVLIALTLPLASIVDRTTFPFNFAGFTGGITNFYVVDEPLAIFGGAIFVLANVLFWTGWINLNLALFNCIPAFPLDGGHLLRASTEAIVARLPVDNRRALTTTVTTAVGLTMLVSLLLMIFGPRLLTG